MKANTNKTTGQITNDQHSLNLWDYKPWWCQPWSIILTGILMAIATAIATEIIWVRLFVIVAILAWWTYFLVFVPRTIENSGFLIERSQLLHNSTVREQDRSRSDY